MTEEERYDAGDEVKVKKRKTKAQLERERQVEELREILSTKGGRYFVWRILTYCNLYKTLSWADAHQMAILSGMRDVGLYTVGEINEVDPSGKLLMQMQTEAHEREKGK